MELFKLFGSIFIKDAEANKALDNMDEKADGLGGKLKKMGKTAVKWGAGLGAAAGVAGAGMMALANKTAGTVDRIDKLSQKIGMSRRGFQEWEFILSQSGTSIEQMQMGMKTLGLRMDEMVKGTGKGAETFQKLGISVTDASGQMKNQEQMFEETVVKLQAMEDGAEKNVLAMELFGRAGQELMPLLNGTAGSVDDMKAKAQELGLVLGDEAIDAGVRFTDLMDQTKRMLGAVGTQIGASLFPIMEKLLNWILEYMPQIQAVIGTVFGFIKTGIGLVVNAISTLIEWVEKWAKGNEKELDGITKIFKQFFDAITKFIQAFVKWAVDVWDKYGKDITKIFKAAFDLVATTLKTAFKVLTDLFNIFAAAFRGDWRGVWEGVKSLFSNAWNGIGSILRSSLNLIKTQFSSWANMFKGAWSSVWDGLGNTVSSVWDGITDGMRSMVNGVISGINSMIRKVVSGMNGMIRGMNKVPGVDIPTIRAPYIPRYAEGTENHPGGLALVGEKGAELVNLPKGAKVYTNEETNDMLSGGAMNFEKMFEGANFYVRDDLDIKKIAEEIQNLTLVRRRGLGTL